MIPPLLPILIWPLVSLVFFKRFAPALALILTIIGGQMLLPPVTSLDLPLLPALTKETVPALSALLIGVFILGSHARGLPQGSVLPGLLPKNKLLLILFCMAVIGSFMTVLFNGDPLVFTQRVKPGLRLYDAFSVVMGVFLLLLPMLLARKFLARPQDHALLIFAFCVGGLLYSLPTLFEVRMAPQLNRWTYGFFPHDWRQHVRGGAFRPVVFQSHGLVLGIFLALTVLAAAVMVRLEKLSRSKFIFAVIWLLITLFLSRNLGAFLITCMLLPVILMLPVRAQLMVASIFGLIILFYPMVRGVGLIPVDRMMLLAEQINPERAQSLGVRLFNEEALLEKANLRPFWGWGIWGRSLVFNEAGATNSVIDGTWIIIIGTYGWIGYLGQFGLLVVPILLMTFGGKKSEITLATSGLALLTVANLIDLIPNSALTPLTWIMAGALIGRLEITASELEHGPDGAAPRQDTGPPPYARARPNGPHTRVSKKRPLRAQPTYARRNKTGTAS